MATSRKLKYENVKKWASVGGIMGLPIILLFFYLASIGDINIVGYSGDSFCDGTPQNPCYAYINFTMNKDNIYIYPNASWYLTTDTPVKEIRLQVRDLRTKEGWRDIDLTKPASPSVAYAYRFYKSKGLWEIRFVAYKRSFGDNVKWSFGNVDPWWNSTYRSFGCYAVVNSQNAILTDYQVPYNVTYRTGMTANFYELRFTQYDWNTGVHTEIYYWNETQVNSQYSYDWVKIPTIKALGAETICYWYNNATNVAYYGDGSKVFRFFEDLNAANSSNLVTTYTGCSAPSYSSSYVETWCSGGSGGYVTRLTLNQSTFNITRNNTAIELKYTAKDGDTYNKYAWLRIFADSGATYAMVAGAYKYTYGGNSDRDDDMRVCIPTGSCASGTMTNSRYQSNSVFAADNTYFTDVRMMVAFNGTNTTLKRNYASVACTDCANPFYYADNISMEWWTAVQDSSGGDIGSKLYFIAVRNYSYPEPTVSGYYTKLNLTFDGVAASRNYELGQMIAVNITNACLSLNASGYGNNFTCFLGTSYVWNFTAFANRYKFSDGLEYGLFAANGSKFIELDKGAALLDGKINVSGSVMNPTVDFGGDGYYDVNITGLMNSNNVWINYTTDNIYDQNVSMTAGQKTLKYIYLYKYANYFTANITVQGYINTTIKDTETAQSCTGDLTSCPNTVDENWETYDGIYIHSSSYPPSCTPPNIFGKEWINYENYSVSASTQTVIVRFKLYGQACYGGWGGGPAQAQEYVYIWNGTDWEYQWSYVRNIAYAGCLYGTDMPNITLSTRSKYFNDNTVRIKVIMNESINCGVSPESNAETRYYEARIDYDDYPSLSVDFLNDGTADYINLTLGSTVEAEMNKTAINNWLNSSSCTGQTCVAPVAFYSLLGGYINYRNLEFNGTISNIPINLTPIRTYLDNNASSLAIKVPVQANASNFGSFNITKISLNYNGTITYNFTAQNETTTVSYIMNIFWSNFSAVYRTPFTSLVLIPLDNNSKNVTPYGQTSTVSAINITLGSYSRNATLGIVWNNTLGCINLTVSNTSSKANGFNVSTTGRQILDFNTSTLTETKPLYFWLDLFNCPSGVIKPQISYISCCKGCVSCY